MAKWLTLMSHYILNGYWLPLNQVMPMLRIERVFVITTEKGSLEIPRKLFIGINLPQVKVMCML